MPYVREKDFARVRELMQTIKELTEKEGPPYIPDIATRTLKVIEKYILEDEDEQNN